MITNEVQLKLEALLLIDDSHLSERWREFAMNRGFTVDPATQALVIQCRNKQEAVELEQTIAKTITLIAYLVRSPISGVDFRWGNGESRCVPIRGVPLSHMVCFSILIRCGVPDAVLKILYSREMSAGDDRVLVIKCKSAHDLHQVKCETYGALLDASLPFTKFSYQHGEINHVLSSRKFNF